MTPVDPNGFQPSEDAALALVQTHLGGVLTEDWRPYRTKDWHGVRDTFSGEVVRWKPTTG